jgi:mannose/fructose/N-acetylgalactosamine-specific phosphotransferase system component IID
VTPAGYAYGVLFLLGALAWTYLAVRVVFYVSAGLSDRTYPELAIFLASLANIVYPLIAVGSVCQVVRKGWQEPPPLQIGIDPGVLP